MFKITNPKDETEVVDMTLEQLFAMPTERRIKLVDEWFSEADTIPLEANGFKVKYNGKWTTVKKGVGHYPVKFAMFLYNKYGPGHETRYGAQICDPDKIKEVKDAVEKPVKADK